MATIVLPFKVLTRVRIFDTTEIMLDFINFSRGKCLFRFNLVREKG